MTESSCSLQKAADDKRQTARKKIDMLKKKEERMRDTWKWTIQ